jgi:transposase InsO family protein
MNLVGPARVRFAGGKWYVLVVVDDYSRYAWVFFLEDKGEAFGFVRDLVLRLLTQNRHLAPSTQQAEKAGLTRAINPESVPVNFPETDKGIKIVR